MRLKQILLNKNGILWYTFLNFLDKGINFCIPIFIISFFSKEIYSEVEYVISTSLLVSSFLDFGVRSYAFYDFKIRGEAAIGSVKGVLDTILLPQLLLYAVALAIFPNLLTLAVSLRTFFFSFQYVYTSYQRLLDTPYKSFYYSIPLNILLFFIAGAIHLLNQSYGLEWYILGYLIFTVFYTFALIRRKGISLLFKESIIYYKKSVLFSWPVMVCLVGSTLMQNLAKIYGYNVIPVDEYAQYALTLRLFMLALLLHQSLVGYYQKEVFICTGFPLRIFSLYAISVLAGFLLVAAIWSYMPSVSAFRFLPPYEFFVLFLYYILLCLRSYLEFFLMKYNQVKKIALFNGVALVVFGLSLVLSPAISLESILKWQLIAELLNVTFVISFIYLKHKAL